MKNNQGLGENKVTNELKPCKLGDVISFGNGKARPSTQGKIPIYGGNGILGYCDDKNYEGETIIIGRVGAYCGATYYENQPIWVSDNALSAKPKEQNDTKFLYYFLKYTDLNQHAGGSSHPLITQTLLNSLDIEISDNPEEQKAIASVLSSLDDKIDLLQRQNTTLECMAETLFRQWFVEEDQEDWEAVKLGDFVEINKKSINKSYPFNHIEYLDTGSLTEGKIESLQPYSIKEAPSRALRLIEHNDVLISTVRPNQKHYGIINNPIKNLVVSSGFCVLTCTKIPPHFVYLLLTNNQMTEYLHSIAEGSTSTYPSLKPADIAEITFQLPPKDRLDDFAKIANDAWGKIHQNYKQIQTLDKLRDNLLPKLMSGEIRIG